MELYFSRFFAFLFLIAFFSCSQNNDDESLGGGQNENPSETIDPPSISVENIETEEGDDTNAFEFIVKLSGESEEEISVNYQTESGTALAGEDFEDTGGTLIFQPSELEKTIQVKIIADTLFEEDEYFELKLSDITNAIFADNEAVGIILNDDDGPPLPYDGYVSPLSYDGYDLIWQEEFLGDEINEEHWNHELGNSGWGNNELQNYTKRLDNSYIEDGKLIIEAKEESFGGSNYTSARMISATKKEFQYGRIDVRAKLPEGQGMWPAIWMLGKNIWTDGWPACGEIDILELVGHHPSTVHGTIHWSDNGNHAYYGGETSLGNGKFSDEYHVFSIIWDNSKIRWLLDNVQYHEADIFPAQLSEFHNEFFFILNVAVGGDWPGYPDATTVFPQKMYVDYIRVFQ